MTKVARLRAPDQRDWKRQYRLAKQRWYWQSVRLDHEDAAALRARDEREGTSVAELIRRYITWGLENDYPGADHE
jgi:hypothetical protein